MQIKAAKIPIKPYVTDSKFYRGKLQVRLADGRKLSVPLKWSPRLKKATPKQRRNWRLIGRGIGIHWPDVDEDLSVEGLLALK